MDRIGPPDSSNVFIDRVGEAIFVPKPEEIHLDDPDQYLARLDEIQAPRERLFELLKSILDGSSPPTHESMYIRTLTFSGLISGWFYGGVLRNQGLSAEYARKYNAAFFEGRSRAQRHYLDNYVRTVATRGIKHGVLGALLCGASGVVSFGSIVYRNELYYPDWLIGFASLGGLTRFWSLGMRGAIGGAGFGVLAGTIGFGAAKLFELVSGKSVGEMRYFTTVEYLTQREKKRQRILRSREKDSREILSRLE